MKPKKLVLVDFNNVCYQVVFSKWLSDKYKGLTTENISGKYFEELVRDSLKLTFNKVLNILEWNQNYQTDILFAKDAKRLWRKEVLFKEYKAHRKGSRDASPVDFGLVFKIFDRIWNELKQVLPFRFITLERIETDDIIYETIMSEFDKYDYFQIYSTDQDFKQLLRHEKVELYNPRTRKFVESDDAEYDLFEKIVTGDKSDGIPNIYSDSINERQRPIFRSRVKNWYDDRNEFRGFLKKQPKEVGKRFIRNKKLIDMRDIPADIKQEIQKSLKNNRVRFDLREYIKTAKKYHIDIMEEKADLIPQQS